LEDVQILALEQYGAGPFGSVHLADLGAEVIIIEYPGTGGDVGRYVPPFQHERDSLFFETFNRNMMDAYQAMTDWLHDSHPERDRHPVVLSEDLNTWHDPIGHPTPAPDDLWEAELDFVGVDPSHRLIDAYRTVLSEDGILEGLAGAGCPGPLPTSYILRGSLTEHRTDRILVSPALTPAAGYDYAGGIASGSDHALHWADLRGYLLASA